VLHVPRSDAVQDDVAGPGRHVRLHDLFPGVPVSTATTPAGYAPTMSWQERLAARPPTASWWLRRHHCSDGVVVGRYVHLRENTHILMERYRV
jgi:hypothetical protein